jgi:hypothetical protein
MREDMELRFAQSASLMKQAIQTAKEAESQVPSSFRTEFDKSIRELTGFRRRVLAYVYHLRETNLADDIRGSIRMRLPMKERLADIAELKRTLIKDQRNERTREPIASALKMLVTNLNKFLKTYFLPSAPSGLRNDWTITSN